MIKLNLKELLSSEVNRFAIILAILGLLLVFLIPPFQSPDEQTHLYRAYQISEGHIISKHLSYGSGDILPSSLSTSFNDYMYMVFKPGAKFNTERLKDSLNQPLKTHSVTETRFENTAIYPPVAYAPQVVGIWIGKIFSASPIVLLYLARLANLAVWIGLLWLIMKRNKRFALPVFAFALIPIVSFQASSASADVLTTGASLVFTFEVLRVALSKGKLPKNNLLLILGLGILLALCKFPYSVLAGLILIIPASRFKNTKQAWQYKLGLLAIVGVLTLIWLIVAQKTFVNLRGGVDTAAQMHFILTHPLSYVKVLYQTYVSLPSDPLYLQMIGQLGWLDTKLPLWSIMFAWTSLILAIIAVPVQKTADMLRPLQRCWAGLILLIAVLGISTSLYLTWNPPMSSVVDGLQGRYFMPLFGALTIAGAGLLSLQSEQYKRARYIVYGLSGMTTFSTLIVLWLRYYAS